MQHQHTTKKQRLIIFLLTIDSIALVSSPMVKSLPLIYKVTKIGGVVS